MIRLGLIIPLLALIIGCERVEPFAPDNSKPVSQFIQSASIIYSGEGVKFDASNSVDSDGEIVSYNWDFDDWYSGSGKITSHVYHAIGEFSPKLTVTDEEGAKSTSQGHVRVKSKIFW